MIAVIQRVSSARVWVGHEILGEIQRGLTVLVGVGQDDSQDDVGYLVQKIPKLRIFEDDQGKMNTNLLEVGGKILLVSQFTLYGDCRKGLRPSFVKAALPEKAFGLFDAVRQGLVAQGLEVRTGRFGAMMQVELINDGPVTIILESQKRRVP